MRVLADSWLLGNYVAERHAVIEGAHLDRHLAPGRIFEICAHAVVVVADGARLADRNGVGVVGALRLLAGLAHAFAQDRLPHQVQSQLRCDEQRLAVKVDGVTQVICEAVSRKKTQGDLPVRRCHIGRRQAQGFGRLCIRRPSGGKKHKQANPGAAKSGHDSSVVEGRFGVR